MLHLVSYHSHFLQMTHKHQNMNIIIDENIITRVKDCKFLGVIIDENLTWMKHINLLTSKISKNIGVMHKLRYYLYADAIKCLYYMATIVTRALIG